MPELVRLLEEHFAAPFPPEARGERYGEADAVMIDADIYGWCSSAASIPLSDADRRGLQRASDELDRSLVSIPPRPVPLRHGPGDPSRKPEALSAPVTRDVSWSGVDMRPGPSPRERP